MNKNLTIGVDLGGTNTVFGIVSPQGDILCEEVSRQRPTLLQRNLQMPEWNA